ncbi:MAG TPA: 5-(carboxyamino)imidazole ribonucleotide mutase [Trueperaceae bacterium]|mgnify:CR=1 FL=1|nr:5-(carboxyamino)imidazole ribonucleotide mutase [Trueperaceae bacterium]
MARVIAADRNGIATAAAHLRAGGLVAFPTETVYGLGAAAGDPRAVARVFAAKGRPRGHPLIVHLGDASALWQWADRDAQAERGADPALVEALAERFWPGPLTLVLHARPGVDRAITGGQDTVALRVPASPVARALIAAFGAPLVAPSANRFGHVSPTRADHVAGDFGDDDVLVLDGGPTDLGLESTILDLTGPEPRLLRPGALPLERVRELVAVVEGRAPAGAPRAPGSLDKHYAPRTPLRTVPGADLEAQLTGSRGAIARRAPRGEVPHARFVSAAEAPAPDVRWLVLPADPEGFARELFAAVRHLDGLGLAEVLVEQPPADDAWLAVRDRLLRAAGGGAGAPLDGDDAPGQGEARQEAGDRVGAGAAAGERPLVAVVMGSGSDWETMRHADEVLTRLGVPHTCHVVSAHRTPERLAEFARGAADAGYEVIVAGAGGAAHLPGMLAAHTHLPVLGVPVRSSALSGLDSLLSIVQMPRGVPVGTLAIGEAGAANAGLLAAAVLALTRPELRARLLAFRREQTEAAAAATLPTPTFEP